MARVLILYGTSEGQTAKIVRAIAMRLNSGGIDTDVVHAGTLDPKPCFYAAVIVAASVHAGGYQKPVARWLRAHRFEFGNLPTAFVSVCLAVLSKQQKARDDARDIPRRFADGLGWQPTVIKVVAGALPYTKYNVFIRWIMKRIASEAGGDTDTSRDYEYTDWKDLNDFTERFAALVMPAPALRGVNEAEPAPALQPSAVGGATHASYQH
jgi:menaquinone-dependent protoporphyrinogen oxidase